MKNGFRFRQWRASIVLGAIAPTIIMAAPIDQNTTTINNSTNSRILSDDQTPKRIYVLPPITGVAGNPIFSLETPSSQCDSIRDLYEAVANESLITKMLSSQRLNLIRAHGLIDPTDTNKIIESIKQIDTLQNLIFSTQKNIQSVIGAAGKEPGGYLTIPYNHTQMENIQKLKNTNNNTLDFIPIDTYRTAFFFSVPGSKESGVDLTLLPVVLSYSVAGIPAAQIATNQFQLAPQISVTLSLTKLGACYYAFPEKFGIRTRPIFGMTAVYEYPLRFRRSVNARYNLKKIYRFLQETGTSGGLFTSESWSKTIESNWGESAFTISWTDDDPESKISPAERKKIEETIKADLLANIATLVSEKAGIAPVQAANPGPHGATVVAEGLEKGCPGNGYCMAAAIGLRALDAIFGSSSSKTEIESKIDVTATYSASEAIVRYVKQGISYNVQ